MQENNRPVGETTPRSKKSAVIAGIAGALVAGNLFLLWKTNELHNDLSQMRSSVQTELSTLREQNSGAAAAAGQSVNDLRQQLEEARNQAASAASQANRVAQRHAEQLVKKLEAQQQEQQKQVATDLLEVKQAAVTAHEKISDTMTQVSTVGAEVQQTKSELEKTVAALKTVRGDMGVQSGLIATNSKELAALRELGERNYIEFNLAKSKQPQRVGNIAVTLKKADLKRNRYTLELIADDKRVEKKDKSINEPVQFYVSKSRLPYELVVNEVQKDRIVGYLSTPKVMYAQR